MNDEYIKFLAQEARKDKLVIFVGAGVSKNSGLPNWNRLIDEFAEYLEIETKENYSTDETLNIPQIFYNKFGKIKYYEILKDVFDKKLFHHEIHDILKKLDPNHIITTNYDDLIETKLNEDKIEYDVISKEEDLAHSQRNKMIIKMHGDLKNKNIVLKKDDYDNYEEKFPLITTYIKSLFTTNTVLFIGYSLNDINVQLIMKWIKEILKEDFRRVYLADFSKYNIVNKKSDNNNSLINKIFLNELEENKRCLVNNEDAVKGELLSNFLNALVDKIEELDSQIGKFFMKLDYISDLKIKKLARNINIQFVSYQNDDFSPYLIKELSIKPINQDKLDDFFNFDLSLLLKSNINNLNDKNLTEYKSIDITKEELKSDNELKNNLFRFLISYDFEELNDKLKDIEDRYQYLQVYCYYFQNKFSQAKKILVDIIENNFTPELIVWAKYNKNLIDQEDQIIKRESINKINNIEKEYMNYFNNINTDLYLEIFERDSLKLYENRLNDLLFKIKENKNSSILGYTQLEQAKITINDFLNYIFLNGYIVNSFKETKSIFRIYLDIIFYAFKNDTSDDVFLPGGKKNKLKKFTYVDLFIMQQIKFKKLSTLMSEHNINQLTLSSDNIEHFINSFNNYLKYFIIDENTPVFNSKLDNFLKILSKLDLSDFNINNILINLSKKEIISNYSSKSYSIIITILNDNLEKLDSTIIKKYIINFLKVKNRFYIFKDNYIIGFLSYAFNKKTDEKLDLKCELKNKNYDLEIYQNIKIKDTVENLSQKQDLERKLISLIYLTRVVNDELRSEIINAGNNYLNQNFSVEIYLIMIKLDLINQDSEYEEIILKELKNLIKQEDNILNNNISFIKNIIVLNLEEYTSEEFKESIKEINSDKFKDFLKDNGIYNIFQYSLEPENFDFKNFNIGDFDLLTQDGLKDLLNKDSNNHLKALIKDYLVENYNEDKYLGALLETEI